MPLASEFRSIYEPGAQPLVVIPNVADFYEPITRRLEGGLAGIWRQSCLRAATYALLWGGDHRSIIVPGEIDKHLILDVKEALGYRSVTVLSYPQPAGPANWDEGEDLLSGLREQLSDGSSLIPWAATERFRGVAETMVREMTGVRTEMAEPHARWIMPYLDSKVGFRDFAVSVPGLAGILRLPSGHVCSGLEQAFRVLTARLAKRAPTVLKSSDGASGGGNAMFTDSSMLQDSRDHLAVIDRLFPLLRLGPVVVEEAILSPTGRPRSVSASGWVSPGGGVSVVGHATTVTSPGGDHCGAVIGTGALPQRARDDLSLAVKALGRAAAALGYAGPIGLDAVIDLHGRAHCVELNPRLTMVTHLYCVARHHFGPGWTENCAIASADNIRLSRSMWCYERARDALGPIGLVRPGRQAGVMLCSALESDEKDELRVGVLAMAENARAAVSLCKQALRALGGKTTASYQPLIERETTQ